MDYSLHSGSADVEPLPAQTISMRYEQLLMVQQRQFTLSLEQKDAELAHLKACFDVLEGRPQQASLAEALRTKEEEAALMMAAKHKELELMVGLLQLREQQIEELRCKCEDQQMQLGPIQEMRKSPGSASPTGRVEHSPSSSSLVVPNRDDANQTRKEVRRLRLRMEELEATVGEQSERSANLARELHLKSEKVEVLEEHIQSLQAPVNHSNGHRPVVSRLFQEAEDAPHDGGSQHRLRPLFHEEQPRSACSTSPIPPQRHGQRGETAGSRSGYFGEPVVLRRPGVTEVTDGMEQPHMQPWDDVPDSSVPSQLPTYRSAVRTEPDERSRRDSQGAPQETADAGRQSQELLREMRRLRMQMNDLEQVAAGAREPAGGMHTTPLAPQVPEQHGCSSSLGRGRDARWEDSGTRPDFHSEPVVAGRTGLTVDSMRSSGHFGRAPATTPSMLSARSEDLLSISDFAGWEYRPHSDDPTDEAVAILVNRPGGRYRGWRALLCRLESGLYLCGTRRVHLRADKQFERIEASDDGANWADLADMMRGAEASQHALLERAKGAIGMPG